MLRQRLLHRHRQVLFQKRQSLLQRRCNLKPLRKTLLFKRKSGSSNDGFNAKVFILEETLIGYVHNLSHPRRNRGNTMNYCTFVLQTSAQETQEALLYSTHKRPLLLESQNNHTPVKLKHFTYTEDRDKIIVNDMTNIAFPQQCEYSFQYDESTLLQSELITILDILNTRREWDVVTVRGKILNVKDQRQVGSPRKRLKLMEAVLGDVSSFVFYWKYMTIIIYCTFTITLCFQGFCKPL